MIYLFIFFVIKIFVNKIFVIGKPLTKITKIFLLEIFQLYGSRNSITNQITMLFWLKLNIYFSTVYLLLVTRTKTNKNSYSPLKKNQLKLTKMSE